MTDLLLDFEAERGVLAAVLSSPWLLRSLLTEEHLRAEHFYQYRDVFSAVVAVADRGEKPDTFTLGVELERAQTELQDPKRLLEELGDEYVEAGSARSFTRRLRDLHRRRDLKLASVLLSEAADIGDPDKLAQAEALITSPADAEPSTWTGDQLAARFHDRLTEEKPEAFHWPFDDLNFWTGGGLRRKQVVLIGGWTSNGKSVIYDQILEKLAAQGLRCHSYINEMSEQERMDRTVARLSGVPFSRIHSRNLDARDHKRIGFALNEIRVGLTECAGWTAPEIARHIRWNRWDVAGVDILHEIAYREERDLAEIAQILRSTAKSIGCALIACVHLNDNRVTTPKRPVPVLRDVRGSGMLVRGADIVLLIHRDDNDAGIPTDVGSLFAAKIRNGQPNAMGVMFQPDRMRFVKAAG